jgi:glycosyltransferase involved in cell wall biosynthesis
MLIINNFHAFPGKWQASTGERGTSLQAAAADDFLKLARTAPNSLFLVNCNPRLTLELGAAKLLRRTPVPLVSADLVLRTPSTVSQKLVMAVKKPLFRQVDLYIHYFRDHRRFAETFGVAANRHEFVPFKVNLGQRYKDLPDRPDGDYALCFGRSLRDFDTFFAAMERLPYPGAIAKVDPAQLTAHGARFSRPLSQLPANVRILDDDGSEEAQIRILGGAKIVVLPILKSSLVASGISTCLNAMQMAKCVIGSEGPGMSDIFGREIIAVPPEDPAALAVAIRRAWEDDSLRLRTAQAGRAYALQAGGEQELYQRIIDVIVSWQCTSPVAADKLNV